MKKKIIVFLSISLLALTSLFAATQYYCVVVKCNVCQGREVISIEAGTKTLAEAKAKKIFTSHDSDCKGKGKTSTLYASADINQNYCEF